MLFKIMTIVNFHVKLPTGVMAARGILNSPAMYVGYTCTPLQCVTDWVSFRGQMELHVFIHVFIHVFKCLIHVI